MPVTNITNLDRGRNVEYSRQLVRDHLLESYYLINKLNKNNHSNDNDIDIDFIINTHKKFIIKTKITGKNKYKTLLLLQQYQKSKNKSMALMVLANSLNKLSLFREI